MNYWLDSLLGPDKSDVRLNAVHPGCARDDYIFRSFETSKVASSGIFPTSQNSVQGHFKEGTRHKTRPMSDWNRFSFDDEQLTQRFEAGKVWWDNDLMLSVPYHSARMPGDFHWIHTSPPWSAQAVGIGARSMIYPIFNQATMWHKVILLWGASTNRDACAASSKKFLAPLAFP